MNQAHRIFMIKHGAVVAFLGALSGLAYTFVITGDIPGSIRAWHLAHLQGVMTGMLIMVISSCITLLNLDQREKNILVYAYVITGYCYSIGPIWGAVLDVRGIEPVMPFSNILMFVSNSIASISVLIGLGMTIYGCTKTGE